MSDKLSKLSEAMMLAIENHDGDICTDTERPYIMHLFEVMHLLAQMGADEDLQIAGVLHGMEDKLDVVSEKFGDDVAKMISDMAGNPELIWLDRCQEVFDKLEKADRRTKMLVLADAVIDLRNMWLEKEKVGDSYWGRFEEGKDILEWYYSEIQDRLYEMQVYNETSSAYWEMVGRFKDLFVTFLFDEQNSKLYQVAWSACYRLDKGDPVWKDTDTVPEAGEAVVIPRFEAELIEEAWSSAFFDVSSKNSKMLS